MAEAEKFERNCRTCTFWLNPETSVSHSICMNVEEVDDLEANVLLRERDADLHFPDEVSQEDIEFVGKGPAVILFGEGRAAQDACVATRHDFTCQSWRPR